MIAQGRRVSVIRIQPATAPLEELADRGAFLGVSLSNPLIGGPAVRLLVDWASFHFPPLKVLLGDYIERHNLLAATGGNLARAGELAMAKAESVKASITKALNATGASEVDLISSREGPSAGGSGRTPNPL